MGTGGSGLHHKPHLSLRASSQLVLEGAGGRPMPPSAVRYSAGAHACPGSPGAWCCGVQLQALELAALTDKKPRSSGQAGNSHKG